nr:MAG TPA: hypothetical protein [Caudoviricetes sp.]
MSLEINSNDLVLGRLFGKVGCTANTIGFFISKNFLLNFKIIYTSILY